MAVAGTLTLNGYVTGGAAGPLTIAPSPITITSGVDGGGPRAYALINGDNTITIPAGTATVIIAIPVTAQTIKMGPAATAVYTLVSNPTAATFFVTPWNATNLVLNANGNVTVVVTCL